MQYCIGKKLKDETGGKEQNKPKQTEGKEIIITNTKLNQIKIIKIEKIIETKS